MGFQVRRLAMAMGVLLSACGDGAPFSPSLDTVSGSYHATALSATQVSGTTNYLLGGGSLAITLGSDGKTSGRLFIPGGGEGGTDADVDLAGTWTLSGSSIAFIQDGDTFLRDVPFTAARNRLSAESTFNRGDISEYTLRVVLIK